MKGLNTSARRPEASSAGGGGHGKLAIVFLATVLVPALVLGFFGLRALASDRLRVESLLRREREDLLRATRDGMLRAIDSYRSGLRAVLETPPNTGSSLWHGIDQRARAAGFLDRDGVLLAANEHALYFVSQGYLRWLDRKRLARTDDDIESALTLEAEGHYDEARRAFDAASRSKTGVRGEALLGLARCELRLGRPESAVAVLQRLASDWPVPLEATGAAHRLQAMLRLAELVEEHEMPASLLAPVVASYESLLDERWVVHPDRFRFYARELEARLEAICSRDAPSCRGYGALTEHREAKLAAVTRLASHAEALEPLLGAWARGELPVPDRPFRPAGSEDFALVVERDGRLLVAILSPETLASIALADRAAERSEPAADLELRADDGTTLYASAATESTPSATSELRLDSPPWTLFAYHGEEALRSASLRELYVVLTLLLALVMGFGALSMWRTLQREAASVRARSELTALVSHEFKSPIASMRALLDRLRGREPGLERRAEYLDIASGELSRLSRLVSNVLDFRGIETGSKRYRPVDIDLGALVRDVLAEFAFRAEPLGFRIEARVDEAMPTVRADPDAVTQALLNLLDNALKFSPGGDWIGVRCTAEPEEIHVEVEDRGVGFATSQEKEDASGRMADPRGLGLGLVVVRHVVAAHGGRLEIESPERRGARVRLVLPVGGERK